MATPVAHAHVFAPNNKRTIRSEPNEYDKATIVSIYPREVKETKHTIVPGKFIIPAGSVAKPTIVVIGPSSWFRDMGEEMPNIEIPNNAVVVANSIVQDYCGAMLVADKEHMPGLFFIPGEWTIEEIRSGKFKSAFEGAIRKQNNWYRRLVDLADEGWARSNGSPKAIDELMRLAASELGLKDKVWMRSTIVAEMIKCSACGNLRNPAFPVCGACNRIIDHKLAKDLGLTDAVVTK